MYMPIRHVGEIGPKPINKKMANTKRHLIWVAFIWENFKRKKLALLLNGSFKQLLKLITIADYLRRRLRNFTGSIRIGKG